ncbi:MAG: sensor histidine kinase [Chitinophagaceae bacterium]|jgi:signal transduction histidine kinase|nr:sensor histidine kinase [Chitinophagaceae bacterium]
MGRILLHWKNWVALLAILIVTGTIFYSQFLAKKIAVRERQVVEQWAEATQFLIRAPMDAEILLATRILTENKSIPIIETNENDSILNYINIDTSKVVANSSYLTEQLKKFKAAHPPVIWTDPVNASHQNKYYYGESSLLNQVRYYPLVQLCIVALFITLILVSLRSSYLASQNQVWAGMAKETAHQLGTPVSSLEGWLEMLRDIPGTSQIVPELEKDIRRLQLVSDRFGKIGSKPQLEKIELTEQVKEMVEYMKKRAGAGVQFNFEVATSPLYAQLSPPLFNWVIENLLKNALDALNGGGTITVRIFDNSTAIHIEVSDTGKGIPKNEIGKVFNPGFTTKKRGWGLGLTLSRRIVEQFHGGKLFVKQSELGKGTTFAINLPK